MTSGDHGNIAALKKLDVFEFYARLEVYEEDLDAKLDNITNGR